MEFTKVNFSLSYDMIAFQNSLQKYITIFKENIIWSALYMLYILIFVNYLISKEQICQTTTICDLFNTWIIFCKHQSEAKDIPRCSVKAQSIQQLIANKNNIMIAYWKT